MDAPVVHNIRELLDRGQIDRAEELSTDALTRTARDHGENSVEHGVALIAHAEVQCYKDAFHEAESLCAEAVSILEQHEVTGRRSLAEALFELGYVAHLLGKTKDAEVHIRRALDMLSPVEPSDIALAARALLALGHTLQGKEQRTDAETAFRQACDLCAQSLGPDHSTSIAAANAFAGHLLLIDEIEEAEPIIRQTWHRAGRVLHEGHREFAVATAMMGRLLAERSDLENAESFLQRSTDLSERYRGKDSLDAGDAALSLGVFLQTSGQISEADKWLRRSLTIYERLLGKKSRSYADALVAMGHLLEASHAYGRAWEMYLEAYRTHRENLGADHPACINHLLRIARICQLSDSEKDASWAYNEAVQIAGRAYGPSHPSFATCIESFSSMLVDSGDAVGALKLLERAQRIREAIQGERHPEYLACLARTAHAHMAAGDLHSAKVLLGRVMETHRELNATSDPQYTQILLALAAVAVQEHRPARALSLVAEAMEEDSRNAHHVFSVTSDATREGMVAHLSIYPALALSLTARFLANDADAVKSAFNSVVRQKGIDGEIHVSQRAWSTGNGDPSLSDRLIRLNALRRRLAAMLLMTGSRSNRAALGAIGGLHEKIDEMEADLARSMPLTALTRSLGKADANAVLSHIPEDAVLIEFACVPSVDLAQGFKASSGGIGADRYYALVASPAENRKIMLIDLGDASAIDASIHRLRNVLSHHEGDARGIGVVREAVADDFRTAASEVRQAVLDPVLAGIGETNHLIISPDGELNLLAFGVLPLEDGDFLVDRYVIQYLGSSRELVRFGEKGGTVVFGKPAVVADPDFDLSELSVASRVTHAETPRVSRGIARGDMHFPLLPGTREEGECVAELLPGATLILGREATVPRFMELQAPLILHVATHGFFCPDQANGPDEPSIAFARRLKDMVGGLQEIDLTRESEFLRSGLVLSGVNVWARGEDTPHELRAGILSALDILGMDLMGTDLVVLSACETGLGTVYQGQGVFGLRRAFALAGAKSLVMTLWRVDDQATRDFMVEFYQLVVDGCPKAAALTEAQRRLKKRHPDPSVWGAFIFQGAPGPVQAIEPTR